MVAMMTGEFPLGLGLLLLYGMAALTRNVLEPKLLGAQMGMSPLIALGAVYAGWRIGGIWGMLLLPVLVMTGLTLYRGFRQTAPAGEIPRSQRTFTVKYPEK
jgi:predicted PurR-regulated permease PerM